MPKIVLANVDNEMMCGDLSLFGPADLAEAAIGGWELMWLAETDDVLVLPFAPQPDFLAYLVRLLGLESAPPRIVVPAEAADRPVVLSADVLLDPVLVEDVRRAMAGRGDWTLLPYYHTAGVAALAAALGVDTLEGAGGFVAGGGAELLNSKSVFRRIAAGRGLPIAEGAVCASRAHFEATLGRLLADGEAVIVKQDLNAGGFGNAVVTRGPERPYAGARQVLGGVDPSGIAPVAERLWSDMTGLRNDRLIVERYRQPRRVVYSEFEVRSDGTPVYLNHGVMRMEPVWNGFEIPGDLDRREDAAFLAWSSEFARLAGDLGYAGLINMDAVATEDGDLIFTEFNGRLGGCSHIHVLGERLIGPDYLARGVALSRNHVAAPPLRRLLAGLEEAGLSFDRETGEGTVVMTADDRLTGTVEYLVFAADRDRADHLERRVERLLASAARAPMRAGGGLAA